LSPTSPTTQSCANPVSCGLWKNPRISPGFPRHSRGPDRHFRSLLPATADGRGKNAARSLARASPFPADFIPTDRDPFACRLRPVGIYGRRATCTHDLGCAACRHTMARRVLPRLRHQQGYPASRRSTPARLGRHAGARPAVLLVSGLGADAADGLFALPPARRAAIQVSARAFAIGGWVFSQDVTCSRASATRNGTVNSVGTFGSAGGVIP
jgi:hypothetical protein